MLTEVFQHKPLPVLIHNRGTVAALKKTHQVGFSDPSHNRGNELCSQELSSHPLGNSAKTVQLWCRRADRITAFKHSSKEKNTKRSLCFDTVTDKHHGHSEAFKTKPNPKSFFCALSRMLTSVTEHLEQKRCCSETH